MKRVVSIGRRPDPGPGHGHGAPQTQTRVAVPQPLIDRTAAGDEVTGHRRRRAPGSCPRATSPPDAVAESAGRDRRSALDDTMARAAAVGVQVGSKFEHDSLLHRAGEPRPARSAGDDVRRRQHRARTAADRGRPDVSVPMINAPPAWAAGHTGAGWPVAILDTGVEKTHTLPGRQGRVAKPATRTPTASAAAPARALAARLAIHRVGSGVTCSAAVDCDHGTHVAGIAAGANGPGGANGVAPGAVVAGHAGVHALRRSLPTAAPAILPPASAPSTRTSSAASIGCCRRSQPLIQIAAVNMSLGGGTSFDRGLLRRGQPAPTARPRSTTCGRSASPR